MTLPDIPEQALLSAMTMDKKNAGSTLRVIVLRSIGSCVTVSTDISFFQNLHRHRFCFRSGVFLFYYFWIIISWCFYNILLECF